MTSRETGGCWDPINRRRLIMLRKAPTHTRVMWMCGQVQGVSTDSSVCIPRPLAEDYALIVSLPCACGTMVSLVGCARVRAQHASQTLTTTTSLSLSDYHTRLFNRVTFIFERHVWWDGRRKCTNHILCAMERVILFRVERFPDMFPPHVENGQ